MNWYYVSGGQQAGPVEETQLEELFRTGAVKTDTLVWHEGMPNWAPYGQVKGPAAAPGAAEAPPVLAGGAPTPGANEAVCNECGKIFPVENMIQYGASRVCAGCKPAFFQRLQEGASVGGSQLGGATEADLLAGDYEVNIGDCVSRGWELFKAEAGTIIGASALVYLALFAINAIPYLSVLLALFLTGPLMAGLWLFYLKNVRQQPATIGDAFSGFSSRFWQYFLVNLIPNLLVGAVIFVIALAIVLLLGGMGMFTRGHRNPHFSPAVLAPVIGLGFIGIAVAVYFQVCWFFALPLVADKGLEFWPALQLSRRMVMKHWGMTFLLVVVVGLIAMCGALACLVGVIVTGPLAFMILCVHYENVFGKLIPQQPR
jgi:hypothetical protein